MKGFKDKNNKFHPIRGYKGVRKSDRKKKETEPFPVGKSSTIPRGKLIQMQREAGIRGKHDESQMMAMPIDMSVREQMEWENAVDSEIVKVKHEMMDGRPITSVRFANGEEWFEFDSVDHQEDFLKENNIKVDEELVGEFVEVNHPKISGYITMPSGKVAFGEKEDTTMREARDEQNWQVIDNHDPEFMRFMNRVDQTGTGELEDRIFTRIGEDYVDTAGDYNFKEKNDYNDIIEYTLSNDGQETLDDYKKILAEHPEIVKEFMRPHKLRGR